MSYNNKLPINSMLDNIHEVQEDLGHIWWVIYNI